MGTTRRIRIRWPAVGLVVLLIFVPWLGWAAWPIPVAWIPISVLFLIACCFRNAMSTKVDAEFGMSMRTTTLLIASSSALGMIGSYAPIYWQLSHHVANSFDRPTLLSRPSAIYFAITTFSTTGYGDITPKSGLCQMVVASQMLIGTVLLVIVVAVIVGRLVSEPGSERRRPQQQKRRQATSTWYRPDFTARERRRPGRR